MKIKESEFNVFNINDYIFRNINGHSNVGSTQS
ncbi:hypothetical protein SE_1149 [Staphylococcus epidermidis ATCC 12228]|uniref:Uncharacterized protein n=1 Tax=Staphylococcus epidermidis (strain ATCC 12228 / FDA PCI 1200) TaxID=176280 RepID=A0A0H2VHU5_STAES|nr:hypothetical protein SE_1149 [Staphylococcus epidermidis ATCC 12228]